MGMEYRYLGEAFGGFSFQLSTPSQRTWFHSSNLALVLVLDRPKCQVSGQIRCWFPPARVYSQHPSRTVYALPSAGDLAKQPGYVDLPALIFISSPGKRKPHIWPNSVIEGVSPLLPSLVPRSLFHWKGTQVDVFLNGFDFITLLNDLARYLLDGELPRGAWPINV